MRPIRLFVITVILLVNRGYGTEGQAQKGKLPKGINTVKVTERASNNGSEEPALNEKKIRDMITFLGFMLNTLGSSTTSARDKDVMITESYSKIFRDAKVQVEDDLDEKRSVITNKDIVAYLKDISFFFKEVKFEFVIEKVEQAANAENHTFFKVTLHRNLRGTTADGKTVNNIVPRYIEVNFDPKEQDLKIVSIYTNEFNEKEAMQNWWNQLSLEWQVIFRKKFSLNDSITLNDIRKITSMEELNLSNNKYIQSLEPLSQLMNLKILDLSFTDTNDLTPIRNLTELIDLNLSHTRITDLSPLHYSGNLVELNVSDTEVSDISVIQRMPKLQSLNLVNTQARDISPIADLNALKIVDLKGTRLSELSALGNQSQLAELNISNTIVSDLSPLTGLKNLHKLVCDSTPIKDIRPLTGVESLNILQANYTLISDLQPLQKLTHLEKVYCDQTQIKKAMADEFMATNPNVLVIYDSHDLQSWWAALTPEWQEVISRAAKISRDPPKEELARVGNVDSINLYGNTHIVDLEPLRKLLELRVIIAAKTSIRNLSPLKEHRKIKYLDINETGISDFSAISQFTKLKVLKADHCKIETIEPLQKIASLEKLYLDDTNTNDINAQEFLLASSKCLLIYKTVHLNRWWRNLSEHWKNALLNQMPDTTRESLHKLVEQEALHFKDVPVSDFSGLSEFIRLKELYLSGTAIVNIVMDENLRSLNYLQVSDGPVRITDAISHLTDLEGLDISNTPIEDLTPIWKLEKLKSLNCSGTQIKRLDAVEKLESLEFLDCSNTNVSKLNSLDYLHLKTLKCYNTRVSNRTIENFKAVHPECKVIYYR